MNKTKTIQGRDGNHYTKLKISVKKACFIIDIDYDTWYGNWRAYKASQPFPNNFKDYFAIENPYWLCKHGLINKTNQ